MSVVANGHGKASPLLYALSKTSESEMNVKSISTCYSFSNIGIIKIREQKERYARLPSHNNSQLAKQNLIYVMNIWIKGYCVLFKMWPGYYAAINFGARPFPRVNKRRRITGKWILSDAYHCYTSFPSDFEDGFMVGNVRYEHELYNQLFGRGGDLTSL